MFVTEDVKIKLLLANKNIPLHLHTKWTRNYNKKVLYHMTGYRQRRVEEKNRQREPFSNALWQVSSDLFSVTIIKTLLW